MLLKADQQRVTALLTETVTLLCKNGLHFKSQFKIEGLIGITLDQEDIFLVNINETVAVEGPAREDDGANSPALIEGRPGASKKRRQRHTPAENTRGPASDASLPSAAKQPLSASTPKESFATAHHDNSSTSDHRSRSPAQPTSVKSQSEDAGLARPGSPRPTSSAKASDTNASDRVVSFCDVPIKLDYALSSRDHAGSTSESHPVSEPASKRPRRHVPSQSFDASLAQEQNSVEPSGYDMPQTGSSSCKMEPSDIIEIKEESLSDDEMKESIAGYSSYAEYGSATAAYGNSDLDASHMYGETSGFQAETMFQGDMQGNAGLRSHETQADLTSTYHRHGDDGANAKQCVDCGKSFSTAAILRAHIRTIHRKEFRYVCPMCGKGVAGYKDLEGHMAARHNVGKLHRCSLCMKEYAYKNKLKMHLLEKHGQADDV